MSCSLSEPRGSDTWGSPSSGAPRPLPAPSRLGRLENTPYAKGLPAPSVAPRVGSRLPVQLRELPAPAPPGHRAGPPRGPAAGKCHPPLPQGQLTGAFDSPACGTQRPAGRQPCLTESHPRPLPRAQRGALEGGCPGRPAPWEAGALGASPRPPAPFLRGPEQSHTPRALVSPPATQWAVAGAVKGLGGPVLPPKPPGSLRLGRVRTRGPGRSNAEVSAPAVAGHGRQSGCPLLPTPPLPWPRCRPRRVWPPLPARARTSGVGACGGFARTACGIPSGGSGHTRPCGSHCCLTGCVVSVSRV